MNGDHDPFSRIKWYLAIPTMLTELPPPSPESAPTGPCAQSPGSGPPTGSIPLLMASAEGPPRGGVRTRQRLGFPYHLIFILLLSLCFGPWNFPSCSFKQFILFILRETERKIRNIKSQKNVVSAPGHNAHWLRGKNTTGVVTTQDSSHLHTGLPALVTPL
ncbi:hypothetical protein Cadr_000016062 [Camelus dromedarius]|uniref:Uncharacterized protein n=1 Tax=Camelus dromedarius TaxID=9838 RepID=A0A5N4EA88_CAMDR|nr:hypothetical protein Cadr_000016062 [Camelus dromedarius]